MARTKNKSRQLAKPIPATFVPATKTTVKKSDSSLVVILTLSLLIVGALTIAAYMRNSIYRTHVTLWRDITKRSPDKRRAHENYGQALSTAGAEAKNPNEAKELYQEALKQFQTVMALRDDGSVPMRDLYREIGVVYFRTGRYDDAISAWQTGLRYAPNDPSLSNNLSIVLMQTGKFDEAAAQARTALAMDPRMPQALNTMAQVYMTKQDFNKAIEYFLKALESEPDVPDRYWNVALAMSQAKKYDLALQYANKYASMEPDPAGRQRAAKLIGYLQTAMKH
ncbi:MAG TPA: tetratricopeptide repeat protein [Nitrospirota bacterium]|nr:tetratricopeptide repeat protein [Nitrospirota bacterium]